MSKLYEGFHVGVELEVECPKLYSDTILRPFWSELWSAKEDGSLRDWGLELVSKPLPFPSEQFTAACKEVAVLGKSSKARVGHRTSMHIHVNVRDLEPHQIKSFLYLSYCMEPLLLLYSAPWRRGSSFAIPSWLSPSQAKFAYNAVEHGDEVDSKYAAIGLYRYQDLGTVEFRMFEGTFDPNRIAMTVKLLHQIYKYALRHSVRELQDVKRQQGIISICAPILRTLAEEALKRKDLESILEMGAMSANDFANSACYNSFYAKDCIIEYIKKNGLDAEIPTETSEQPLNSEFILTRAPHLPPSGFSAELFRTTPEEVEQ